MIQDFKSFANQNSNNFGLNESITIKKQINTIQNVLMDLESLGKKWDFQIKTIEISPNEPYISFFLITNAGSKLLTAIENTIKTTDSSIVDDNLYQFAVKI